LVTTVKTFSAVAAADVARFDEPVEPNYACQKYPDIPETMEPKSVVQGPAASRAIAVIAASNYVPLIFVAKGLVTK